MCSPFLGINFSRALLGIVTEGGVSMKRTSGEGDTALRWLDSCIESVIVFRRFSNPCAGKISTDVLLLLSAEFELRVNVIIIYSMVRR